ncbi:fungal-specific transcription factor domain-containing protein [Xylariales sp. AK1849]|nr:fungal-specific transcription factor domain-containing protein [Xylariales sp. AK1849]
MAEDHKRQCWECLRRRLVCDSSRPICRKCQTTGVVCPGYEDKKPIKWLAPGTVTSWPRRRKRQAASQVSTSAAELARVESDEMGTIPRKDLRTETCDIFQALHYYNTRIYPDWVAINELGSNPWIVHLPLEVLHVLPPSICHTLTYWAFGYRICQLAEGQALSIAKTDAVSKLYHHRGIAIQSLSGDLAGEQSRTSDATISAVLLFMFVDLRHFSSANWHDHFKGATQLILLRGGPEMLYRSTPRLKVILAYFIIVGVMGNTTSPAADQITPVSHLDQLNVISEIYGEGLFPCLLCPPSLFLHLISINFLRFQAAGIYSSGESPRRAACDLMHRIEAFSPEKWALSRSSSHSGFLLLGRIYKSAIALYCKSSLRNLLIPAQSWGLDFVARDFVAKDFVARDFVARDFVAREHCERLFALLKEALASESLKRCLIWPMIIAGLQSMDGDTARRTFVEDGLVQMSRDLGTSLPLLARSLLRRSWESGKAHWDDCFDRPYAFVV